MSKKQQQKQGNIPNIDIFMRFDNRYTILTWRVSLYIFFFTSNNLLCKVFVYYTQCQPCLKGPAMPV